MAHILVNCEDEQNRKSRGVDQCLYYTRFNVICLVLVVNFTGSGAFFSLMVIFFSATVRQVASSAQLSSFLLKKPGQPPLTTPSTALTYRVRQRTHAHRHTPTHTVGGDRQLRGQMCCTCNSYFTLS